MDGVVLEDHAGLSPFQVEVPAGGGESGARLGVAAGGAVRKPRPSGGFVVCRYPFSGSFQGKPAGHRYYVDGQAPAIDDIL